MMRLLQTSARDLYRSKGVLAFAGQGDAKFVFQGVHEQISFGPSQSVWGPDETRCVARRRRLSAHAATDSSRSINRMVFIGRKLDREALEKGFKACLASAPA